MLHQQVKQSTVNLPKNKPIGEINWSGRLILAELKAWHEERSRKQSELEMSLMVQGINIERETAAKVEEQAFN